MEVEKLKKIVLDFQNGIICNDNPNYVSVLLIEHLLTKKYQEFIDKSLEYAKYLEKN